ncbi:hypothetical protein SKAU_G00233450 [Synaphobranchus kaupii]|uniref:Uncharacterized protein n=1 Tax=Synaphobranchus kaupii TaxID=118154 RepID=A0A9Q1F6J0_SYNKA|nr:hypothetical protein SKAU_G00233450 [Synaphobranchus kaupii]
MRTTLRLALRERPPRCKSPTPGRQKGVPGRGDQAAEVVSFSVPAGIPLPTHKQEPSQAAPSLARPPR